MSDLVYEDVTVRFGSGRRAFTAVDGVNLSIPSGGTLGLVGESGSGKSTLARAAVGLAPIFAGRIRLGEHDVLRRTGRKQRQIQMIFQNPYSSLDPRMTIGESIREARPPGSPRGAAARREVERLVEMVQLDPDRVGLLPADLSGGQRQRVALARALAGRPEVVIADEITSALDVSVQAAVLNVVRELQRELGFSMLFISHNISVVRYLCESVVIMYMGKVVEAGPTTSVLSDPQHPYTRELVEAVPPPIGLSRGIKPVVGAEREPATHLDPPRGCRYHPRCPMGPTIFPDRQVCAQVDPSVGSVERVHRAACHFAKHAAGATGGGQ